MYPQPGGVDRKILAHQMDKSQQEFMTPMVMTGISLVLINEPVGNYRL